ncbi:hypothetical protein F5X68DRAFT_226824 [Plectosphaerella plurivora]|uniref:Uncharacterized protein n=1 Tax=Plectosphaerella plurivora TaxID=936078 RepID=A0A9P8VN16_9PEZI|nr:hypothetical protein F5X68DRAFT_226824 [Plectosphaerella plurivora]
MSATTSTAGAKRFELPALNFNFSSLTEGTNIPPPPDSPVEKAPTPPKTPVAADKRVAAANGSATAKAANGSPAPINPHAGTKRPADDTPLSPASSSKAGSIRRLFSRNLLNNAYAEGETQSNGSNGTAPSNRPMSRSNGSILDEKKTRRGSGFFRRFTGGGNTTNNTTVNGNAVHRPSNLYQNSNGSASKAEVVRGPPPPMIPELSALESKVDVHDGGSLGSDLFKNIK